MRDFVLIGFTPRHRASAVPAEALDELQRLGHVYGIDALGALHRLIQERAVGVAVLASERGVHEDSVRALRDVPDVGQAELHVRARRLGIAPGNPQGGLGDVVSHDHACPEHPRADGEHSRSASEVHDLQALYVPVAVRRVQDVRRDGRRCHVLLQRRVRIFEVADGLQPDLEVPLPHPIRVG